MNKEKEFKKIIQPVQKLLNDNFTPECFMVISADTIHIISKEFSIDNNGRMFIENDKFSYKGVLSN